jgi:AcrR family transcriptional regulator
MGKGARTRARIIAQALEISRKEGLSTLTLSDIADAMKMTKSGVFAHFGSREALQLAVIRRYAGEFRRAVLYPALRRPPGPERLQVVFERWVAHMTSPEGTRCICLAAQTDRSDDAPALALREVARQWQSVLRALAAQAGEEARFRADYDPDQLVFEMQALVLGVHHEWRLHGTQQALARALSAFRLTLDKCRSRSVEAPPCGRE